jgi:Mg2+/Co2+ transporter CorB
MLSPLFTLCSIVVLLLIAAVFCMAETALLSASKARLTQRVRQGDKSASIALDLLKHPDQLLGTILIILTLVPVATSALTTHMMLAVFGPGGVVPGTVILAVAIVLVGEAFPKAVGTRFPEPIALALAPSLRLCVKTLAPATWAMKTLNRNLLTLMGLNHAHSSAFTESDLRGAFALGQEHGALGANQRRMLDAVLDLDDLTIADVMIHRSAMHTLNLNTPPEQIPAALAAAKHSRLPVYQDNPENLIGMLVVRDYLHALSHVASRKDLALRPLLRPLYYAPTTTPIGHQLHEFLRRKEHLALVVDEYGDLQGLVTLEDILEEIVGDIADEQDMALTQQTWPQPGAGNTVTLPGQSTVRDVNRAYTLALSDDHAITLAGLLVHHLGHLPAQGESVQVPTSQGPIRLAASSKRGHKLERVTLTLPVGAAT